MSVYHSNVISGYTPFRGMNPSHVPAVLALVNRISIAVLKNDDMNMLVMIALV
jgi:hypothetical protein